MAIGAAEYGVRGRARSGASRTPRSGGTRRGARIRAALATAGAVGAGRRGGRAHRADARRSSCSTRPTRSSGRRSCGTTSGRPRSATLIRARGRAGAADRDHRQRRAHRLHGARSWSGSATTSPTSGRRIAHVLLPKDYVRHRLTGDFAIDKADGAGHDPVRPGGPQLVGRGARRARDRPRAGCRETFEGPEVTGVITAAAAAPPGSGPGRRSSRAAATRRPTRSASGRSTRASWRCRWGRRASSSPPRERRLHEPRGRVHAFCHAVPGRWHLMSVMLSAAGSLRWFRDALAPGVAFGDLAAPRGEVPAGSDGLLFLPYLTGERSPHPDPLARGAFVGLTLQPRPPTPDPGRARGRRVRAARRARPDGRRGDAARRREIRASGGGMASPLWRQILADVLGAEIVDRHHDRGRGLRRGAPGRGRSGLVRGRATRPRHRWCGRPQSQHRGADARGLCRRPRCAIGRSTRPSRRLPSETGGFDAAAPGAPRGPPQDLAVKRRQARCSVTSPGSLPRMIMPRTSSG